ncbi:MAG: DedA family protein [Nanoarchaeota archaeon]
MQITMFLLTKLFSYIGLKSIQIISFLGYFGVFILMALESMIFPIPSELVMPFAGFLAATGELNFFLVIVFASLGSLAGSLASYYMGKYGGNRLILRWGKYMLLDKTDLLKTEKWFRKKGQKTVLISRFIPVVRHIISIPAGIGKMHLKRFCIYTIIGATIWNTFLAYLGYLLGKNWEKVKQYTDYITIPLVIIIFAAACYFIYRHVRHKRGKKGTASTRSG